MFNRELRRSYTLTEHVLKLLKTRFFQKIPKSIENKP